MTAGLPAQAEHLADRRAYVVLTGVFVLVHAVFYAAGLRFDRTTLIEVMHFLDPELLRTQFWESIWYLHIQPPLLNVFTGAVLMLTPDAAWLFQVCFLGFGLSLYLSVYALQRWFGVRRAIAGAIAIALLLSPSFLLYEHFLLYTLPCAALLTGAAVALAQALERRSVAWLAGFFVLLLVLCATRSLFHLAFYLVAWGAVGIVARGWRRRALLTGLAPAILLVALYAKTAVLFGPFSVSTIMPKNLWIMTAGNLRWDDKVAMGERGELSALSLINRWASLDAYPDQYRAVPPRFQHVEVLTTSHKSTGAVNYNHYGYLAICDVYLEDAVYVLKQQPRVYAISVALSSYRYFRPPSALAVSPVNRDRLLPYVEAFDAIAYGRWPFPLDPDGFLMARGGSPPYVFLLVGLPALALFGLWRLVRGGWPLDPRRAVLAFMLFSIATVFGLGVAFDFLETNRYRLMSDGFYLVLLGLAMELLWRRLGAARRRTV